MPRDRYEPIRLNQTNKYAGYQFHAGIRVGGMEGADAFRYLMANDLADVFRAAQGNLKEEDAARVMGCEISFHEGSMTRKDSALMKLREDEYEGKAISVEPHLKLKTLKGEPEHQRLHFGYDPETKKIIIGYVGDHLESAATRYAGQR